MQTPRLSVLAARQLPLNQIFSRGLDNTQAPVDPGIIQAIQSRLNFATYLQEGFLNQDLETATLQRVFRPLHLDGLLVTYLDHVLPQHRRQAPLEKILALTPVERSQEDYFPRVVEELLRQRGYTLSVEVAINRVYNELRRGIVTTLTSPGVFHSISGFVGFAWDLHQGKYRLYCSTGEGNSLTTVSSIEELLNTTIDIFTRTKPTLIFHRLSTRPVGLTPIEVTLLRSLRQVFPNSTSVVSIWEGRSSLLLVDKLMFVPDFLEPGLRLLTIDNYLYLLGPKEVFTYFGRVDADLILASLVYNQGKWHWSSLDEVSSTQQL